MSRHKRLHSNTISNDRPPAINTTTRPNIPRRNSEGSPGVPPPQIDVSAPTPLQETHQDASWGSLRLDHFPSRSDNNNDQVKGEPIKSSSFQSLPTPVAAPEQDNKRILRLPLPRMKTRSRSSSTSTTNASVKSVSRPSTPVNEQMEGSSNHSTPVRRRRSSSASPQLPVLHRRSDGTEGSGSEGEVSMMAPGSIATAVRVESISEKRNQEFHALFRSVPEDDALVEDYGCALQKEILVQGRLYISENHLCFNANIFGWVTNLVIAFADIVEIEKRSTAIFIPNAIQVSTLQSKHFFASFLSRDQAYDLIVDVWRYSRPLSYRSSNGSTDDIQNSQLDQEDGIQGDYNESSDMDSDYTYSGTETEEEEEEKKDKVSIPPVSAIKKQIKQDSLRRRALSEGAKINGSRNNRSQITMDFTQTPKISGKQGQQVPTQQPSQAHERTDCTCGENGGHYPNTVMDETYNCSLETMNNLMYNSGFMKRFLIEDMKSIDLNIGEWIKSEDTEQQIRKTSYIKPLNGSIGPKQTQCLQTEEVIYSNLKESVTVLTTTQTPDVPSGNSFSVKTKTCMTWAGYGRIRMLVTVLVDFTKSSWLKSTIDKASVDGQISFYKQLDTAIKQYMKAHPAEFALDRKHYQGRKRKKARRHKKKEQDKQEEMGKKKSKVFFHGLTQVIEIIRYGWTICRTNLMLTLNHWMVVCMVIMICVNLLLVQKMVDVESRLNRLTQPSNEMDTSVEQTYRDELWSWLQTLDGWDRTTTASSGVLDDSVLDQDLLALAKMVRRAEKDIGQVSQAVEKQRRRIQTGS